MGRRVDSAGVNLPMFSPREDPGPSFVGLLAATGYLATSSGGSALDRGGHSGPVVSGSGVAVPHGTTVVAIRFADGVVMAGDRRATEGYSIAHRKMEKVLPADRMSAVAIAGAAGPAIELVKLFQTQLEHYEKVEGRPLTLEGKANQLAMMVRSNLPMAMQGLVVVPLFAGFDEAQGRGRIFAYDVTGGRYEEADYHATGSGGRDARTTVKLGYREGLSRAECVTLALRALYEAADEDTATGGPDVLRGIYPTVATISRDGFEALSQEEVAGVFGEIIDERSAGPLPARGSGSSRKRTTKPGTP